MRYVQNQNTLEIHRFRDDSAIPEVCNTDAIKGREELEEADALRIIAANLERRCGHCWGESDADSDDSS